MKTALFYFALTSWLTALARSETVELTTGPSLRVTHDPAVWKLAEPVRKAQEGVSQFARWQLQHTEWAEITLASHRARKTEAEYKEEILDSQKFRGDAAELVRERRESLAGRDWLVLELRNPHTRPTRSENYYFLSADHGHATLFLVSEEAKLPKHREAIEAFLKGIEVK